MKSNVNRCFIIITKYKNYNVLELVFVPRTSNKGEEILRFIAEQTEQKGYPPSVREICEAVGLRSTSTVHAQLKKLEQKGYIAKDDLKTRALKLTDLYYEKYGKKFDDELLGQKEFDRFYERGAESEYLQVPVLGRVAAGEPILALEEATDVFPLPMDFASGKDLFMLTVRGDSMIEAAILDGDYIIVERQQTAHNGEIVVALVDDSATVKTFYKENGHFRLQPENSSMEPIIVQEVIILGKVVGVFRKM